MENPKILLHRTKTMFSLVCFALATYYVITQVVRYIENKDSSAISQKTFNEEPNNKYPTFSICLKGKEIYWKNEHLLFSETGMTSSQYVDFLEGNRWRYNYNATTRLYEKERLNDRNKLMRKVTEAFLDIPDIIVGAHFESQADHQTTHFGYGTEYENLQETPFHIGYQSSDEICYTRNFLDEIGLIRTRDVVYLNGSHIEIGNHLKLVLKFIMHYPGQLMEKIDTPLRRVTLKEIHSNGNSDEMFWEGKIVKVSILRNRPDAFPPCYDGVVADDVRFRREVIKKIGCIPIYWKNIEFDSIETEICKSDESLRELKSMISSPSDILSTFDRSCIRMDNLVFRTRENTPDAEHLTISVSYMEQTYQETVNIRDFPFESFFSSLGGFIGIFLGYSMLQIPELLSHIPSIAKKLKISTITGKNLQ